MSMNKKSFIYKRRKFIFLPVLFFSLLLILTLSVKAVQLPALTITALDSSQFPTITVYMEPYDSNGLNMGNINPDNIRIEEDNNILGVEDFTQIEPGIHWITAINAGPRLKDLAGGAYRFETIRTHLLNWMQTQSADSPNDYSIATNTGVLVSNIDDPLTWSETFQSYQPDFSLSQPNLVSLSQALDLAGSAEGQIPQKYTILYITPMMPQEFRDQLPDIAAHASQMGVQVDVWLVGAGTLLNSPAEQPFKQLAEISGGSYFFFSGVEDLPYPSDSLEKLRWLYRIQYHSRMQTGGIHSLTLSMLHDSEWKESNTLKFKFDVLPPNPIFFSPPSNITRIPIKSENRNQPDTLEPENTEIRILVEFPDQYKRELTHARLFANDMLVARNTQAPFDRFQWDLSPYTESQTIHLKVDIQDEAGFSVSTTVLPVQIIVETRQCTFFELIIDHQRWIIGAAIVLTMILLGSAFYTYRGKGKYLFSGLSKIKKIADPLLQQVNIPQLTPMKSGRLQNISTSQPSMKPENKTRGNALLVRLDESLEEIAQETIHLPDLDQVSFGSHANRVTIHLNDSSVSGIHARICIQTPHGYTIYDEGSVAGTWLNYAPISALGADLHHGDTIQFGRLTYRFKINYSEIQPGIILLPYNEETK